MTAITGRQPPPASPWVFGPWYQATGSDRVGQARTLRQQDVPVSALQTYLHYLPCGDQQRVGHSSRPTASYHALGLAITTFNPMICTSYAPAYRQAAAAEVLTKNALDQPYRLPLHRKHGLRRLAVRLLGPGGGGVLQQPAGRSGRSRIRRVDGGLRRVHPARLRSANGMDGTRMHNLCPKLYHCASWYARARPTPPVAFIRSGWTGVHPCAQVVWGGDPTTAWGFDGLESAVKQALSSAHPGSAVGALTSAASSRSSTIS